MADRQCRSCNDARICRVDLPLRIDTPQLLSWRCRLRLGQPAFATATAARTPRARREAPSRSALALEQVRRPPGASCGMRNSVRCNGRTKRKMPSGCFLGSRAARRANRAIRRLRHPRRAPRRSPRVARAGPRAARRRPYRPASDCGTRRPRTSGRSAARSRRSPHGRAAG